MLVIQVYAPSIGAEKEEVDNRVESIINRI